MDHIICFAVGRPLTTPREYIDVELPHDELVQVEPFEIVSPFPSLIRIIQIQGRVSDKIRTFPEQEADLSLESRHRLLEVNTVKIFMANY